MDKANVLFLIQSKKMRSNQKAKKSESNNDYINREKGLYLGKQFLLREKNFTVNINVKFRFMGRLSGGWQIKTEEVLQSHAPKNTLASGTKF